MNSDERPEQLELLPAKAPAVRRARVALAQLTGFEHATPDAELIELIARLGLLQPIVVTAGIHNGHRVIEGRRRVKAIQQLAADGRWPTPARLDALILEGVDKSAAAVPAGLTLALHATRSDSPASELHAIEAILSQGLEERHTIKEIAAQTGMPVQTVRRRLRLRNLTPTLRVAFDRGHITTALAEAAARPPEAQQRSLAQLLEAGHRVTLKTARELAHQRTATATENLPTGLFADQQTPWPATARGHLNAALDALPETDRAGTVAEAITQAITLLERQTAIGPQRS